MDSGISKTEIRVYIIFVSLTWIYLLLRSVYVPLVHDEVATFFWYVHSNDFIPFIAHWDANNHVLNSLLTWICYRVFGPESLVLRLPSLLFAWLFFYYCFRIAGLIKYRTLRWFLIIPLVLSHYFIGFFGLARGYGMSMALLFGALWYLFKFYKNTKLRSVVLSLVFMAMACLANLTLINTLIILIGLIGVRLLVIREPKNYRIKAWVTVVGLGILPLVFFTLYSLALKERGALYYGLQHGFWEVTVNSLIKYGLGATSAVVRRIVLAYFIIIVLGMALLFIGKYRKENLTQNAFLIFILLIGNVIATVLLNKLLGVNYPEDRAGLYFYPLFILALVFTADWFTIKFNPFVLSIMLLPLLYFPAHMLMHANLTHDLFFQDQRLPLRFYKEVVSHHQPDDYPPTVQANAMRHFVWQYYNFMDQQEACKVQYRHFPEFKEADYIIVRPRNNPEWGKYYDTLDYDGPSDLYLMKRKKMLRKENLLIVEDTTEIMVHASDEFVNLYKGSIDSLHGKSLYVGVELDLESSNNPLVVSFVTSIRGNDDPSLRYESLPLDWFRTSWTAGERFKNGLIISELPEESKEIVIYLWNRKKQEFRLISDTIEIFVLE